MAMRQQAAVRIDRQLTAKLDTPALDEAPALALGAKPEVFQLDNHDWREAIVKLRDVDIPRPEPRHCIRARACLLRGRGRETARLADMLVRMAFAAAEQIDRPGFE